MARVADNARIADSLCQPALGAVVPALELVAAKCPNLYDGITHKAGSGADETGIGAANALVHADAGTAIVISDDEVSGAAGAVKVADNARHRAATDNIRLCGDGLTSDANDARNHC